MIGIRGDVDFLGFGGAGGVPISPGLVVEYPSNGAPLPGHTRGTKPSKSEPSIAGCG